MEHLQIAYDLFVIMIGLAALSIVVFWAAKTGAADLRDFSILYICFTLVLVVMVLKKYLFLNVEDYSARAWYGLSGAEQILGFAGQVDERGSPSARQDRERCSTQGAASGDHPG